MLKNSGKAGLKQTHNLLLSVKGLDCDDVPGNAVGGIAQHQEVNRPHHQAVAEMISIA